MKSKIIEATNGVNWGRFLLQRFDTEWDRAPALKTYEIEGGAIRCLICGHVSFNPDDIQNLYCAKCPLFHRRYLLQSIGLDTDSVIVTDLVTCEGAIFRPGGYAHADLQKHRIWVCPLFEPFLAWLYQQKKFELDLLPDLVELPDAPSAIWGYRRPGAAEE